MIEVKFYEVYEEYDRDSRVIARFSSYVEAMNYANESVYRRASPLAVFYSIGELESYSDEVARRIALEKLSPKERKLLGLE
jgi:hypothetical protein